jgi:hypothetical protein
MKRNCLIIGIICVICLMAGAAMAKDVTLSWNYAADMTTVDGFKLYASTSSGQYTADDVIATVDYATGQAEYAAYATIAGETGTETTYYFVATAYNDEQESDYSNEVDYTVLGAPAQLTFSVTLSTE